jgi:hypothetical protein
MSRFGVAFSEPSTWRGIVWLLTAAGVALDAQQSHAIEIAGAGIAGLISVFWKDK